MGAQGANRFILYLGVVLVATATVLAGWRTTRPEGGRASPALVQRGAALYNAHCLRCHGGATGGDKRDVPPPHNANGHTWHHPDCLIRDIVLNGFSRFDGVPPGRPGDAPGPKPTMPAFRGRLSDEDVAAILAYVKTWWSEEQRQGQARITRRQC